MENKGIAFIIVAFIVITVGLAFWSTVGGSIGTLARLQQTDNVSFAVPTGATWFDLVTCGQTNVSNVRVFNRTGDIEISAGSFNVRQGTSSIDGFLVTQIRNVTLYSTGAQAVATTLNVTCNYQPRGYITDSGARGVALLIPVFLAIAIAFAAIPDLREWVKGVVTQ